MLKSAYCRSSAPAENTAIRHQRSSVPCKLNWRVSVFPSARAAGFSLLELLVVLALIGLLAAIALPNLPNLYASAMRATERERILDQFAVLGREAMLRGRDQVVLGTIGETAKLEAEEVRALGTRYALDIPAGWDVSLDRPLIVRATGVCLGAEATLVHNGATVRRLVLTAPLCRFDR